LIGALILLTSIWASLLNTGTIGWWLPLIGGAISLIGLYAKSISQVDIGCFSLAATFFLLIWDMPFSYANLIFLLVMFFLFFGLWIFTRRRVLIKSLESDLVRTDKNRYLVEYKGGTNLHYIKTLILGFTVSLAGGLIALNSFIGPFHPDLMIFLRLGFGLIILSGIYLIVIFLPKSFANKDNNNRKDIGEND